MSTPSVSHLERDSAMVPGRARQPAFRGIDHVSFTVTDLAASEHFYCEVLGFTVVLDFGDGLVTIHKATGFALSLVSHPGGSGGRFSHLHTGLDHLGLVAEDRDELVQWEERFRRFGVDHSPIQDEELGHHLNFRDPDGIALELYAPGEVYAAALKALRSRAVSDDELRAMAVQLGAGEYVARRPAQPTHDHASDDVEPTETDTDGRKVR